VRVLDKNFLSIAEVMSLLLFLSHVDLMNQVMGAYGYCIEHILMVDIIPDDTVRRAMNEINAGINHPTHSHLFYYIKTFSFYFFGYHMKDIADFCKDMGTKISCLLNFSFSFSSDSLQDVIDNFN
jgi:hypothetical protein